MVEYTVQVQLMYKFPSICKTNCIILLENLSLTYRLRLRGIVAPETRDRPFSDFVTWLHVKVCDYWKNDKSTEHANMLATKLLRKKLMWFVV